MTATCPGPHNAEQCDSRACRYGGCQGRMPEPLSERSNLYAHAGARQRAAAAVGKPRAPKGSRSKLYAKD